MSCTRQKKITHLNLLRSIDAEQRLGVLRRELASAQDVRAELGTAGLEKVNVKQEAQNEVDELRREGGAKREGGEGGRRGSSQ